MIRLLLAILLPCVLYGEDKAFDMYRAGERASTAVERRKDFNEALRLYLQLESDQPSAKLCYDIANTYYQLSEYGYAILYYYKALKENPRLDEARANLQIALKKAGVSYTPPGFVETSLLFFHNRLSHNEKGTAALILLIIAFCLWSVHIWVREKFFATLAYVGLSFAMLFFLSLVWSDYFAPPEAVSIRPVALRRDAGDQYAPVVGIPVLSGTKLIVLKVQDNGNWLKVRAPNGEEGYISKEYVRII